MSQRNFVLLGVEQKVFFISVAVVWSVYRMSYVKIFPEMQRKQLTISVLKIKDYSPFKVQLLLHSPVTVTFNILHFTHTACPFICNVISIISYKSITSANCIDSPTESSNIKTELLGVIGVNCCRHMVLHHTYCHRTKIPSSLSYSNYSTTTHIL